MPRTARPKVAGFPLHMLQRGHNKKACFEQEQDFRLYLSLLTESSKLHPCAIHAFVLMTNHVHLLATPAEPVHASRMMKRLNEQYGMYFNNKYGRTGSVWEGRFKTCIVDTVSYLLQTHRYIELNPVRAGMVPEPGEYAWSSYGANAYGEPSDLLTPHEQILRMGACDDERRSQYRRFVGLGTADDELNAIRRSTATSAPLMSIDRLESLPPDLRRVPRPVGRPKKGKLPA
jgi:putative transposase